MGADSVRPTVRTEGQAGDGRLAPRLGGVDRCPVRDLLAERRYMTDTRYRIEYVETKNLIVLLQAAHDYAAANEHRADYWTCMAAYLQAEGLSYRYDPPRDPIDWDALIEAKGLSESELRLLDGNR
jgi:hypothetical protein